MTLPALTFLRRVQAHTGRWPGQYSDAPFLTRALSAGIDPGLQNCWVWLARLCAELVAPVPWPTWTMWQLHRRYRREPAQSGTWSGNLRPRSVQRIAA